MGAEEPEYIVHGSDIMVKFKAIQNAKTLSNKIAKHQSEDLEIEIVDSIKEKADKKPIKADKKPIKKDRKETIVKYVSENGSITNKEAKELLNLAASTTKRILKEMSEEGLLTAEGEYKARKYVLNSPPHSVKM